MRLLPQVAHVALEPVRGCAHGPDGTHDLRHQFGSFAGLFPGLVRAPGGVAGVSGHLEDGGVHFLHGRDRVLHAIVLFLGSLVALVDPGGELTGGRGHAVGDGRGLFRGVGDEGVLRLDAVFLGRDAGQVVPEHQAAEETAVHVVKRRGVHVQVQQPAAAGREVHVQGQALTRGDSLVRQGLPAGVVVKKRSCVLPLGGFGRGAQFQEFHGLVVDPQDAAVRPGHGAGGGDAVQHALGEAEAFLEFADHALQVAGQGGEFEAEGSVEGGVQVAFGDPGGIGRHAGQGAQHQAPVGQGDAGHGQDEGQAADREHDRALPAGERRHVGLEGRHAHDPVRGRHPGQGHVFALALPVVGQGAFLAGQGFLDERDVRHVFEQQALVRAVGDDRARGVDHEGVAALPEAQGIDEVLGVDVPLGTHGHAAEELARGVAHGLGHHEDEDVAAAGGKHLVREHHVLAAEHAFDVVAVGPAASGHVLLLGVVAGHDLAGGVEGEDGPVLLVAFDVVAKPRGQPSAVAGKPLHDRFLGGQRPGHVGRVVEVEF